KLSAQRGKGFEKVSSPGSIGFENRHPVRGKGHDNGNFDRTGGQSVADGGRSGRTSPLRGEADLPGSRCRPAARSEGGWTPRAADLAGMGGFVAACPHHGPGDRAMTARTARVGASV